MRFGTHALGGAVAALPIAMLATVEPGGFEGQLGAGGLLLLGAVAGGAVDMDHPYSTAGKALPVVLLFTPPLWPLLAVMRPHQDRVSPTFSRSGWLISRWVLWHRGPVHSPGFGAVLMVVVSVIVAIYDRSWWDGSLAGTAWLMGWCSHLVLDVAQSTAMPWAWPLSTQPLRPSWAPVLNSRWLERLIALALFVVLVAVVGTGDGPAAATGLLAVLFVFGMLRRVIRL